MLREKQEEVSRGSHEEPGKMVLLLLGAIASDCPLSLSVLPPTE